MNTTLIEGEGSILCGGESTWSRSNDSHTANRVEAGHLSKVYIRFKIGYSVCGTWESKMVYIIINSLSTLSEFPRNRRMLVEDFPTMRNIGVVCRASSSHLTIV